MIFGKSDFRTVKYLHHHFNHTTHTTTQDFISPKLKFSLTLSLLKFTSRFVDTHYVNILRWIRYHRHPQHQVVDLEDIIKSYITWNYWWNATIRTFSTKQIVVSLRTTKFYETIYHKPERLKCHFNSPRFDSFSIRLLSWWGNCRKYVRPKEAR